MDIIKTLKTRERRLIFGKREGWVYTLCYAPNNNAYLAWDKDRTHFVRILYSYYKKDRIIKEQSLTYLPGDGREIHGTVEDLAFHQERISELERKVRKI